MSINNIRMRNAIRNCFGSLMHIIFDKLYKNDNEFSQEWLVIQLIL